MFDVYPVGLLINVIRACQMKLCMQEWLACLVTSRNLIEFYVAPLKHQAEIIIQHGVAHISDLLPLIRIVCESTILHEALHVCVIIHTDLCVMRPRFKKKSIVLNVICCPLSKI